MKRLLAIPMLLMLVAGIGCQQKQHITQLEVGREKLLGAGLTIEAVTHLKRAVEEAKTESEKIEPRALVLIAYAHALSTGDARTHGVADTYKQEKSQRLAELNDAEMKKMLGLLNERHRTQQATVQLLIEKGSGAVPLLIQGLGQRRYANIQTDLIEMIYQIGSKGSDQILAALRDPNTPPDVKVILSRLIGRINDPSVIPALEEMRGSSDVGLKMEINIALYQLGKTEYESEIINGVTDSNVAVRRAAAKAMTKIKNIPIDTVVKTLKDSDAQVRMYSAQTLEKSPTQKAIAPLIDILKNDGDVAVKEAAKGALEVHAEQAFGKNLARQLIQELPNASEPTDRVRIVLLLKTGALLNQIKTAPRAHDDNIEFDLYRYFTEKEPHNLVKEELNKLLVTLQAQSSR